MDRAAIAVFANNHVTRWRKRIQGISNYAEKQLRSIKDLVAYGSSQDVNPQFAPAIASILTKIAVHLKGTNSAERQLENVIRKEHKKHKRQAAYSRGSTTDRSFYEKPHDYAPPLRQHDRGTNVRPPPATTSYGAQVSRQQGSRGFAQTPQDKERVHLFSTLRETYRTAGAGKCFSCLYTDAANPHGHNFADCPNLQAAIAKYKR